MCVTTHIRVILCAAAIGLSTLAIAQEEVAPSSPSTDTLEQLSRASQSLYKKIAASTVRVRVDQGVQNMLTPAQRKDFMEWARAQQAENGGGDQENASLREARRAARAEKLNEAATQPTATNKPVVQRPLLALFKQYVDQKLKDTTDGDAAARWHLIQLRLAQPVAETTAVVIDNDGHALILGAWLKDGAPLSLRVIAPDGSESAAKYLGAHPARGFAVIKLDSPGIAAALPVAEGSPAPGELLMCMAANSGGTALISAPQLVKRANGEERFAIFGNEERGSTFLFNINGQLAAVGTERFALPATAIKNDVQWIIDNKKDVAPRQIGVKYSPISAALRKQNRLLANRAAVVVEDVAPNSPADKAGLQKNDIVLTIDRKPIGQLPQIQWDIATEKAPVPIGILRDNKEVTLSMPLD